jgi:hypothetical protein
MAEHFNYLATSLTHLHSIYDFKTLSLKSGNVCYHSVQKLLSSSLLSKDIILLLLLYGCETSSLTLGEEHRLRVSENRKMLRPKKDEVTGDWSRLHNEELNDLYC